MDERLCELKVWQFFSALNAGEKKALHAILLGNARAGSNDVLRTFNFLNSETSEIQAGTLTRADLFRHLHGKTPFNINHFNKPISRLISRIKEFWELGGAPPQHPDDPQSLVQCHLRLMQKLETHGLDTEYDYERKKLESLFAKGEFFEDKYRLLASWKKIELVHHMRLHPHEPRPELREMQIALSRQYEIDQLRIEASIANQQKIASDAPSSKSERLEVVASGREDPIFEFYRTFIALQAVHDDEKWARLKQLFDAMIGTLSQDLLAEISSLLISHASRARNAGHASMQGELLRVYHQVIDSGTLGFANWNIGAHLQNYLFLVGHGGDRARASKALNLANGYQKEGKIHLSTSWLLKAIYEEFFGDPRSAYKYYFACINVSKSTIEIAVARSKQLVFDYEDRVRNPIPPDFGHTYDVFLRRNIGSYPALNNHKNFVACIRMLAAAYYAKPGSLARQKKIDRCRKKIEAYDGQPLLNKSWLLQKIEDLAGDQ